MKIILLFFIILSFLATVYGQTNVYHPFPYSNGVWHQECVGLTGNPPTPVTEAKFFFLWGDTSIVGIAYKKVLSSGYKYYLSSCCYYFNQYECAIRQDTVQRKIYYYGPMSNKDTLLYDFEKMIPGGTLPPTLIRGLSYNYISSVDSVLVGSSYRKQYHVSVKNSTNLLDSNYAQVIEGIGSTLGLLTPFNGVPVEGGCNLTCYSESTIAMYTKPGYTCNMTVGLAENEMQHPALHISPNPFSAQTTLKTSLLL